MFRCCLEPSQFWDCPCRFDNNLVMNAPESVWCMHNAAIIFVRRQRCTRRLVSTRALRTRSSSEVVARPEKLPSIFPPVWLSCCCTSEQRQLSQTGWQDQSILSLEVCASSFYNCSPAARWKIGICNTKQMRTCGRVKNRYL